MMRLLVVSSDPLTAKVLRAILEGGGHEVVDTTELSHIQDIFSLSTFSLIILVSDTLSPSLLQTLSSLPQTSPIIVISRSKATEKLIRTQPRVVGTMVWPTEPAELLSRVETLLEANAQKDRQLNLREIASGVHLDPQGHSVIVHGIDNPLTVTEFRLLHYLAERPSRVCTRDELLDAIWGWDKPVNPREVDVYISLLRKKLSQASKPSRHILTVWGVGYKFER